jgi:hypothetical protein
MRLSSNASLLLLVSASAFAQSAAGMATISGVVRDTAGAAVSNANTGGRVRHV